MAISLDFSQKTDLRLLGALVKLVSAAADGMPFMMAGAMARDLLLVHAHGIPSNRATQDVDLAFLAGNWSVFEAMRNRLLAGGDFAEIPSRGIHKLRFQRTLEVDILPFGGVERQDRTIVLPPDDAFEMSMFGFKEVLGSTVTVILPEDARVQVVSLPALTILKLSAWAERRLREPRKDAYDLLLIIKNYAHANNEDRLYDENPYIAGSPSDFEAGGAWLLGKDMARLLDPASREQIGRVLAEQADEQGNLRLVGDMMNDPDRALELLAALERGFIEGSI